MSEHLSRRDFLKLLLTGLGVWLASCMPRLRDENVEQAVIPTETSAPPTSTPQAAPSPTQSPAPTSTAAPSATPTPTSVPCFRLLSPENGSRLPALGRVTFAWEAMPGAARYELRFTLPGGKTVTFETENTRYTLYIESLLLGGAYLWEVLAYDAGGAMLCAAEAFTFEKSDSDLSTPTKEKGAEKGGDDGQDNGDGSDGGPSTGGGGTSDGDG